MAAEAGLLLGVDIGGTFTDLMLFNPQTQATRFMKVLTTPDDLSLGVMEGIRMIAEAEGVATGDIGSAIHGSTIGINTIIERKGARTGLITTRGFEDILLIARQTRPKIYDWRIGRPTPLVPGFLRLGVRERVVHTGEILEPLGMEDVRETISYLKKHDVESIAVCLLHSYANPAHEEVIDKVMREMAPELYVSISSNLLPEFREYERMSTTVANAYIGPIVSKYVSKLKESLEGIGIHQLMIMQANGGLMTTKDAQTQAIRTIESGPAGGVIAATYIGGLVGKPNLISFDMGGTTAKSCLIADSKPTVTTEYEVSPFEHGEKLIKGTGYPIKTPVIDLVEVGAGGGSIAWVDKGGALRVGPQSTGADPGPACYGRGGIEPTITDANVVLGRINPEYFLGGAMKLDAHASEEVVKRLAAKIDKTFIDTAEGVLRVANSTMARSIRYVSTERGYDLRDFSLVAFGGAAPVQIVDLAKMVGIEEIIVPPSPGVLSAFGFLMADLIHHYVRTQYLRQDEACSKRLEDIYIELEDVGRAQLNEDKVPAENMHMQRSVDMRYIGQSHELNVPVPEKIRDGDFREIIEQFHRIHKMHYGYLMPDEETIFINFRLAATGIRPKPKLKPIDPLRLDSEEALKNVRRVHFRDVGWVDCSVYARSRLSPGDVVQGPCVIEEWDSTTIVNGSFQARLDSFGNIFINKMGGGR